MARPFYFHRTRRFAVRMRQEPTPAEEALAQILKEVGGGRLRAKFVRQSVLGGRWILDFYFPDERIAIEVDGQWHHFADGRRRDLEKQRACEKRGIVLLRLSNREVLRGSRAFLLDRLRRVFRDAAARRTLAREVPVENSDAVRCPRGKARS